MEEKRCTRCDEPKPLQAFSRRSDNGNLKSYCKQCAVVMDSLRRRRLVKEQPAQYKARQHENNKGYRERLKLDSVRHTRRLDQQRRYHLKGKHTLYSSLYEQQSGVCAICGKEETARDQKGNIKALAMDHNHITGQSRGLLCFRCNTNLAFIEDEEFLSAALSYLSKYQSIHGVGQ